MKKRRFPGISGNLRAAGIAQDRRFSGSRGAGRNVTARGSPGIRAFAANETGDRGAEEAARDAPVGTVPGGVRRSVSRASAGLA